MPPALAIVIPTLNAADQLARTLDHLRATGAALHPLPHPLPPGQGGGPGDAQGREAWLASEIIVSDGGSSDDTSEVALADGARLVAAPRGRGPQLADGARAAVAPWLLFLHADTRPAPGWATEVRAFMADPANAQRAGYFRYVLDDPAPAARRVERFVAWRARVLALPYGDQGLVISRAFYDALGGFREIPLMEDIELVRRIGRARLVALDCAAVTSPMRYRRAGYALRGARNLTCLGLYFLGVPPRLLARIYR